ncbi:uncharacterized protein LOC144168652 [Haemaphysalis longicornis]
MDAGSAGQKRVEARGNVAVEVVILGHPADQPRKPVLDKLMASRKDLTKIDTQAEDVIPVEELEREYESAAHYNDQTIETLTRLMYRLEEISVSNLWTPSPMLTDVCSRTSFWEQFNGAVHTHRGLTATDKFHYLRNYRSGEAAAAIAGLPTTETCYESAIQQLQDGFGDTSRITHRHF